MKFRPFLYQKKAMEFLLGRDTAMLMSGKGMGNKAVVLSVIRELIKERFAAETVLLVSSRQAILERWREELKKWDHLQSLQDGFLRGSEAEKIRLLEDKRDIYFVTHDGLAWLEKTGRASFTHVVIDQFALYSKPGSARYRRLRRLRSSFRFMLALSSPGMMNRPGDLWAQMFLLDGGARLERSRAGFLERYFFPGCQASKKSGYSELEMKEGAAERIQKNLADICFAGSLFQAAASPVRYCDMYVAMDGKEYSKYKMISRDMLPIPEEEGGGEICPESVTIRKMQVANGILYGKNGTVHRIHERKLEELKRILVECAGNRIVIVHCFRHEAEEIRRSVCGLYSAGSEGDIRQWRERKDGLLLMNAAGEPSRSLYNVRVNTVIWFSLPWDTALYEGLNEKLLKEKDITIYRILTENTIDIELAENINNRARQRRELAGIGRG
ncbi:MAG: hypothetical protein K5697_16950 [Lachnospiraceae bacterium]|nr:hypothetical protein [Lachnospiraceae bacterium]